MARLGAVYTLVTLVAGFLLMLDAGHTGPTLILRLPISPFTLGWEILPDYLAAIFFFVGLFFWSLVALLLARPDGGRIAAVALVIHYVGVVVLVLTDRRDVSVLLAQGGGGFLFAVPYFIGQVVLWAYLVGRTPPGKNAA